MTGSAVASLTTIAAPHLEMLLRALSMAGDERAGTICGAFCS